MTAATLTEVTAQTRFNSALKSIRKVGITTRMNKSICCRGCAEFPENTPILWTMGGQGEAYSWHQGVMVNRAMLALAKRRSHTANVSLERLARLRGIETQVYFYFTDIVAAEAAQIAFEAEGFEVDWDGTEVHSVIVKM